jgi:hypothetical protein
MSRVQAAMATRWRLEESLLPYKQDISQQGS